MAPKPIPTKLKLLKGTARKDRINPNEPNPDPAVPVPPAHLDENARAEWKRITPELEKLGLLSNLDMAALAAYCLAYSRWVKAEQEIQASSLLTTTTNGNVIQNPLVGIANKAMFIMHKYLTEFGMTPSSRTRVAGNEKKPDSGFGALRSA